LRRRNFAHAANNLAVLLAEKGEVEQAIALLATTLAESLAPESLRPVLLETPQKLKHRLPSI